MNKNHLQALIVDQHFGELSEAEANSLEALLAADAGAREEARHIHAALATIRRTVLKHPELARPSGAAEEILPVRANGNRLAMAAAVAFAAALGGSAGFWAGHSYSTTSPQAARPVPKAAARADGSPWTRYRIASNPGGAGLQIVRLETSKANNTFIK
jgi:hypothetical protein